MHVTSIYIWTVWTDIFKVVIICIQYSVYSISTIHLCQGCQYPLYLKNKNKKLVPSVFGFSHWILLLVHFLSWPQRITLWYSNGRVALLSSHKLQYVEVQDQRVRAWKDGAAEAVAHGETQIQNKMARWQLSFYRDLLHCSVSGIQGEGRCFKGVQHSSSP